jgi:hypothetical protein
MNPDLILTKYESHHKTWIELVNHTDKKNYSFKPSAGEWSLSEVMDHLTQVTNKCLDNAMLCAENKGETGHSGFGPSIFSLMGSFPPVKLHIKKIPAGMEPIYQPNILSKQEALDGLSACLQRMQKMKSVVAAAGKKQRVKHWAGGWFNANQWYHSAEMHLKHHFRQFRRLKKRFPVS